ncbi:hypothetical protein [Streptomyces sp. NPDC018833]|uniref:hypothetical protein n=1 Tax=Streptomyces sp. NPDC018833 TaxID=3365053 RepID=UPI0037AE8D25
MATVTFVGGTASGAGGHAPGPGAVAYLPSPWESQDRIDSVGRLAAEGDPGALVAHLLYANGCEGYGAVSRLRAMPEARRRAFADALVEAAPSSNDRPSRPSSPVPAVLALARMEGGAGHAELSRLADRVSHTVTLRRIRRALAP